MKILIAAGGTGGHVYPAIAIAKEIRRRNPESQIVFVGTRGGFEATIVPEHGFEIEFIELGGLNSASFGKKIRNTLLLPKAFLLSDRLLHKYRPHVVFGIGGYTSGPLLLLAALKKIPTAILECNAIAGATNRWLGKFCGKVFGAFEVAQKYFPKNKYIFSGIPIRDEILKIPSPRFDAHKKTVFIFGGSQGASRINKSVLEMLQKSPEFWKNHSFIHQTGPHDFDEVKKTYHRLGIEADVRKFFNKIYEAYAKAHFVIARSGSSVMEISAIGLPSILIPYPYAADDHQKANAEAFAQANASVLVKDHECNGEVLFHILKPILESDETLQHMSRQALTFRIENAASIIVDQFSTWARE